MTEPPAEAKRSDGAARALSAGRDERRHGCEVIGVRRVSQAEHHGHREDDEDAAAAREMRDPVVETEHRCSFQPTVGRARAVITRPAARMIRALTAGSALTSGPSKLARRKTPLASTATRPIPLIVNASPTLKSEHEREPERDPV